MCTQTYGDHLDILHSEVVGIFLSLIDDYSRNVWVYILKTKDIAFQRFKEWKKLIEMQTGRKVKKLRTDNGWEFVKDDFENFYVQEGISRHKTVRYAPPIEWTCKEDE